MANQVVEVDGNDQAVQTLEGQQSVVATQTINTVEPVDDYNTIVIYNTETEIVEVVPPTVIVESTTVDVVDVGVTVTIVESNGDVTAAANLANNTVIRGDGGVKGIQDSGVSIDDSDNVTGIESITMADGKQINFGTDSDAVIKFASTLFDILFAGSTMRWFESNGNISILLASGATYTVQGTYDPVAITGGPASISASFAPSEDTSNGARALYIAASAANNNDLGDLVAISGAVSYSRSGSVSLIAPLDFSVNITGAATITEAGASDVNINVSNVSAVVVTAFGSKNDFQGSNGMISQIIGYWVKGTRTGTTGAYIAFEGDNLSSAATNTYAFKFGTQFINNKNLKAIVGSTARYIPWSRFNDGQSDAVITTVSTATYTALLTDSILHVTRTATGTCTITLPAASTASGKKYVIKDAAGSATTNNITIDGNALETIDGTTTVSITENYGSITIYSNGTAWFII